ncbi:4-(cytidine 5'-diphospho)-2-C-methyl-D-erythritol kinase [Rhizosphaericola mali]|uniref:4-diphosphocytidyl-2-C-methyl-D-erythritol kinase n=1 Tax=Rhizosphaericola mali TaxID=2545455 RepID=A0A5P2G7U4_9BACT|nr:4-(cytidine 5'-diphospho)-2-C-methyl-D-erythritol kinase [Rhizosphaericola mali]QES89273.1 4-(cytidine 5'-diphospho)-2-C-methyl-D-erythritol kinase [Rhizosphaericola mali]
MVFFPNCKINLGLHIVNKREDGFHNLETIFYPLPLCDIGEIIKKPSNNTTKIQVSGIQLDAGISDNICIKAFQLLKTDYPQITNLDIYLHKNIPVGAGLGGGSADGTFILKAISDLFYLQITAEQLAVYALQLGSDCPYFLYNQPAFATQRGEHLTPMEINLCGKYLVLINPGIHINTGWAFKNITPNNRSSNFQSIHSDNISEWKNILFNDFEEPVFTTFPEIQKIKKQLYTLGAIYASMSGTGSSVFGIFDKKLEHCEAHFPKSYFITNIDL